ncbi:MarR family winged helix-turn-helix transcriptional regulator [Cellulomonas massiliensis]|uniref:MarR family winged helix-turn-helix transcriptional regulator n=1 Tax=Cellulomonas massiliensis TaxID=1465811 RepID=UPI0002DDA9E9|nr:MarR family transcriptional regulator [Cellulomonas massiliensis]
MQGTTAETAPLALLRATEAFTRTLREASAALARDVDCSRATLTIVRILDFHGPMQVGDLAHRMRVDISVASRQVGELVEAGLVERVVDPDDRRVRRLGLTAAGGARARDLEAELARRAGDLFVGWSDDELRAATGVIGRLTAAIAPFGEGRHDAAPPRPAEPALSS